MFEWRSAVGTTIPTLLIAPGASRAQEPVHSFEQLRQRAAVGQTVIVTDGQGREVHGTISDLSASVLVLDVHGIRTEFLEPDVERIGRRDSRWNGTLWGLGVAGVSGAWIDRDLVEVYGRDDIGVGDSVAFVAGIAAVGAGIGFAVDALIKGQRIPYLRPASSVRSRSLVTPVWLGRRAGIFVSVAVP